MARSCHRRARRSAHPSRRVRHGAGRPAACAPGPPVVGWEEPEGDDAPFPANRQPDAADASGDARLSPVDLRFGVHDGYDRVVLDLVGEGAPGWRGEYVDDPTRQAVGEPVYLDGDAYLVVLVRGLVYPTEPGAAPYEGPRRITPVAGGVVVDVVYGSLFEASRRSSSGSRRTSRSGCSPSRTRPAWSSTSSTRDRHPAGAERGAGSGRPHQRVSSRPFLSRKPPTRMTTKSMKVQIPSPPMVRICRTPVPTLPT